MICYLCHIGNATVHPVYGVLPCDSCRGKQKNLAGSSTPVEFTSESIKQQRKAYWKDFVPMSREGLSKEWLDQHGAKKAKQHGFTDQEIKHAKNQWDDLHYYGEK